MTFPLYFDFDGKPIDMLTWARLFEDFAGRQVAFTTMPDGKVVSTVWLGLDHNFVMGGPILIYETMVFEGKDRLGELYCQRYSTREQAIADHDQVVAALREGHDIGHDT